MPMVANVIAVTKTIVTTDAKLPLASSGLPFLTGYPAVRGILIVDLYTALPNRLTTSILFVKPPPTVNTCNQFPQVKSTKQILLIRLCVQCFDREPPFLLSLKACAVLNS